MVNNTLFFLYFFPYNENFFHIFSLIDGSFNEEVHIITGIKTNLDVPMFKLKALDDEELHGYYYAHELSRVRGEVGERQYRIENIIEERGNKSLVKFIGFKKPEWLLTRNIDNLS
jgi:hypothetical protein